MRKESSNLPVGRQARWQRKRWAPRIKSV